MTRIQRGHVTIRIERDEDPFNPRDEDNIGTMVCWHRRYTLGDEKSEWDAHEFWWRMMSRMHPDIPDDISREHIEAWREKHYLVLPLYLYDHGGQSMSTGSFSCPWDSGQVGWIYCSLEKAAKNWSVPANWSSMVPWSDGNITLAEAVEKCLKCEVDTYDMYLQGEVYGYIIEDDCEKELESCWGFYGEKDCIEEAKRVADHINEKLNSSSYVI